MQDRIKNKGLDKAILEYRKNPASQVKYNKIIEELKEMKKKDSLVGVEELSKLDSRIIIKRTEIDGKLYFTMFSNKKYVNEESKAGFLSIPFTHLIVWYFHELSFNKNDSGGIVINPGSKAEFVLNVVRFLDLVDKTIIESYLQFLEEREH